MSVIYSFMDDCLYGADEINRSFSKLTTQGVSLFNYSNGENPLKALNDAAKGFLTPGIEMYNINACKVVYDSTDEKFTIAEGNAFMCDGSSITIDGEAYDITETVADARKTADGDVYVCFYRNIPENSVDISVSTNDVTFNSEYSVRLARITENNIVYDRRTVAKTKLAPCSANVICEETLNIGVITYHETGASRKRLTLPNVFPGATKVIMNGVVHDIQRVDADKTDTLVFARAWPQGVSSPTSAAFNMTGDGLEVWLFASYNSETISGWKMIIF